MVTVVCKNCNSIIEHDDDEKVRIVYSLCEKCKKDVSEE
jgi:hypothetical protein